MLDDDIYNMYSGLKIPENSAIGTIHTFENSRLMPWYHSRDFTVYSFSRNNNIIRKFFFSLIYSTGITNKLKTKKFKKKLKNFFINFCKKL